MTEQEIRSKAAEILTPGPWKHEPYDRMLIQSRCVHCGLPLHEGDSPSPCHRSITDPLEVIAERLVKKCGDKQRGEVCRQGATFVGAGLSQAYPGQKGHIPPDVIPYWLAFEATPLERCEVLIQAVEAQR